MAGHRPWSELRAKLTPAQKAQSDARYHDMKLGALVSEMRTQAGLTQVELAERLGIGQSTISQMESSEDMRVATLRRIIVELGGELVLRTPSGEIPLCGNTANT